MTYKEAYNKIIDAYFKNEINPYNSSFCFCGTLVSNSEWYKEGCKNDFYPAIHNCTKDYTGEELGKMEYALLTGIDEKLRIDYFHWHDHDILTKKEKCNFPEWEEALFQGMSDALDVLKEIHKSRGEDVDQEFKFEKRQLVTK